MSKRKSNPGEIHLRIVEVLKRFPNGARGGQIRQGLEKEGLLPEEQTHLDRRKRDLKKWLVSGKAGLSPARFIQQVPPPPTVVSFESSIYVKTLPDSSRYASDERWC
jgi:hypothetical protein